MSQFDPLFGFKITSPEDVGSLSQLGKIYLREGMLNLDWSLKSPLQSIMIFFQAEGILTSVCIYMYSF